MIFGIYWKSIKWMQPFTWVNLELNVKAKKLTPQSFKTNLNFDYHNTKVDGNPLWLIKYEICQTLIR